MNWPNRLSLMRIGSVPVITLLLVFDNLGWTRYVALFLFIASAITDFVDGHLARKYNLVTNFGKFIDPVADKMLVLITMIMLTEKGLLPGWAVCVVALIGMWSGAVCASTVAGSSGFHQAGEHVPPRVNGSWSGARER